MFWVAHEFYWHLGDEKFARKKFAQEFWIGFHQWMMGFLQKEKNEYCRLFVCVFFASCCRSGEIEKLAAWWWKEKSQTRNLQTAKMQSMTKKTTPRSFECFVWWSICGVSKRVWCCRVDQWMHMSAFCCLHKLCSSLWHPVKLRPSSPPLFVHIRLSQSIEAPKSTSPMGTLSPSPSPSLCQILLPWGLFRPNPDSMPSSLFELPFVGSPLS